MAETFEFQGHDLAEDDYIRNVCRRCGRNWLILKIDAPHYQARIQENVCWTCEPEGW